MYFLSLVKNEVWYGRLMLKIWGGEEDPCHSVKEGAWLTTFHGQVLSHSDL